MPSCEKCWSDSFTISYGTSDDQVEVYHRLIEERSCTPEEQAGVDATICDKCGRKTIHQICKCCMNPECLTNNPKIR